MIIYHDNYPIRLTMNQSAESLLTVRSSFILSQLKDMSNPSKELCVFKSLNIKRSYLLNNWTNYLPNGAFQITNGFSFDIDTES